MTIKDFDINDLVKELEAKAPKPYVLYDYDEEGEEGEQVDTKMTVTWTTIEEWDQQKHRENFKKNGARTRILMFINNLFFLQQKFEFECCKYC